MKIEKCSSVLKQQALAIDKIITWNSMPYFTPPTLLSHLCCQINLFDPFNHLMPRIRNDCIQHKDSHAFT